MQVFRDGKPLDRPNDQILILGEAPASKEQDVPLRVPWCRKRLLRDHGYKGWPDEHFDVANVLDEVQKENGNGFEFPLEEAVQSVDCNVLMGYERIVTLGRAWMAVHEALNRRSEIENIDFQNDMCAPNQIAGYKWLRILRWPHPSGLNRYWNDEDECEWAYMVYRAFVGLVVDRAAEHMDRMERRERRRRSKRK